MTQEAKVCQNCKVEKPFDDFYRCSRTRDGRDYRCKKCDNKKRAEFATTPKGKAIQVRKSKNRRLKLPGSCRLKTLVESAKKSGKLIRSEYCEVCGSTENLEFHHDDYAYALDGRVLCCQCHNDWHSEHGEAKNRHLLEPDGPYAKGTYKLKRKGPKTE